MPEGGQFVTLWREQGKKEGAILHLFSPEHTQSLPFPANDVGATAVEEFLPELARVQPAGGPRWLLLLEPSLPDCWQALPWERLTLHGRPLCEQTLIVRKAQWSEKVGDTQGPGAARLLNLFPAAEHDFLDRLQPYFRSGRIVSGRPRRMHEQLAGSREFIIVAHGRTEGLVDAEGRAFALPRAHPMPERIWLLACNVGNAMQEIAERLLAYGCRTVIVATGDLSAPEMERLITDWCSANATDPASWLAARNATGNGDVRALTAWGQVDLDASSSAAWNRIRWLDAHGLNPRMRLDDETSEAEFRDALGQADSPGIWPLARKDMLAPLLWLAEKFDHAAMARLRGEVGEQDTPAAAHALAVAARRVGNYVQMAKYLSRGLGSHNQTQADRADHFGAMANLFIDLDLPEAASEAIREHENCHFENQIDSDWAEFKRLDWTARAKARQGQLEAGCDYLAAKRRSPRTDGERELAGMLYLAAWELRNGEAARSRADNWAREASRLLDPIRDAPMGHGNETGAYLLRALSAHAWATGDAGAADVVERMRCLALERIITEDPGPWAYVLVFLKLLGRVSDSEFKRAVAALERGRYYLEAAMFLGLAGKQQDAIQLLQRFQQRRRQTVKALEESAVSQYARIALAESARRCELESESIGNAGRMVKNGVLPL